MLNTYHDQVCVITGASSGIGATFARELSKRGAKVVLFARRADKLNAVAADLEGENLVVVGDVTQADDRQKLTEAALKVFGRVDVLINNAGVGSGGKFIGLDAETVDRVIGVNLLSAIHLTREIVPEMVARQHGLIINVSSPMGQVAMPGFSLYHTSKAGLTMFSAALRRELYSVGIHVIDFQAGFTLSEMVTAEAAQKFPRFIPVKEPEPVVVEALHAALNRRAEYATGGSVVRMGIWVDRNFPRVVDQVFKRVNFNRFK